MEIIGILRMLWRFRLLVGIVAVVAVVVGLLTAYRIGIPPTQFESRQYQVGIGKASALVDTPSSLVVDLGGRESAGIETLSERAALLASLITSSPIKDEIAKRAGVDPDHFNAVTPPSAVAGAPASPDVSASGSVKDSEVSILSAKILNLESGEIPIIAVNTQAPDAARAARLANESIALLKAHLASVAGTDNVPENRRVMVRQLGPARSVTVSRGPGKSIALIATVIVFALGCVLILGLHALVSGWRLFAEMELLPYDVPPEPHAVGVFEDDEVASAAPTERVRSLEREDPADVSRPAHTDAVGL